MAYENLELAVASGVATLTISRPKALNALNEATLGELERATTQVAEDDDVRALVITGAGEKAFVAGADISELAKLDAAGATSVARRGQKIFRRVETLGKPSIAAIGGFALGGGLELALACSLRVAAEGARLGLPEVKLGVIPGYGGTQRLPRLVGRGVAIELITTGEFVPAERALAIGLVNHVVPREELLPFCNSLAEKMCGVGPLAVRAALAAVDAGRDAPLDDALDAEARAFGELFATEDAREGIAAFLEKRAASFGGR